MTLAGCGAQTKTVTVGSAPPALPRSSATAPPPPSSTSTQTSTAATTSAPSATRTAPEPSFAESESSKSSAVAAAAAVVLSKGYTPVNTAEYHSSQTLRVLVGARGSSSDGYGQQAFFFLDGRYLGTDTKEPSARLKVVSQSDTEIAVAYTLYRSGEAPCCATGGQRVVHFQLNDGKLAAADPIPPASSSSGLSRN